MFPIILEDGKQGVRGFLVSKQAKDPVIEVDAGRMVNILFTSGFDLHDESEQIGAIGK